MGTISNIFIRKYLFAPNTFGMKRNMYIERPRLRSKMERQAKERSWKVHTQTTVCFTGRSRMTGKNDKEKGR
jgi:hypothetical protein